MRIFDVEEAFELLKFNKITTHKESVRRWLRQGVIKGIAPTSRKEGWKITESELQAFMASRLPESYTTNVVRKEYNATDDVKGNNEKEAIRAEMWWELANRHVFEGFIEPRKKQVLECVAHKGHSKSFGDYAWDTITQHKMGYAKPHIPYLLDAFLFDGKRIRLNESYELFEEKVLYALIEQIRKDKVNNN